MPENLAVNQPPHVPPTNIKQPAKAEHKPPSVSKHTIQREIADASDLTWPQLVQQLKLTGMAKMLAQHSESKILSADKIELYVPEAHKHLLEKKYQDKIQSALNTFLNKPVVLNFFVGSITGLTPVAIQQRVEEEKQAQAIAAIEKDPIVQELIKQFDAKLIVPSIKPIQDKGDKQ